MQVLSKNSRINDGKKMKTIPLPIETMQYSIIKLVINPRGGFLTPRAKKTQKLAKISKNLKKMRILSKKIAKVCDIQKLKHIPLQLRILQEFII